MSKTGIRGPSGKKPHGGCFFTSGVPGNEGKGAVSILLPPIGECGFSGNQSFEGLDSHAGQAWLIIHCWRSQPMILGVLLCGILKKGYDRPKAHVLERFIEQVGVLISWRDL